MEQQTVNEDDFFEPSDVQAQDVEQSSESEGPAVEATEEQTTSNEPAVDESAADTQEEAQTGDALDEFIAKKGIDPSDPDAVRKIAEMYQNVERGFYQKSQEKAALERELANAQPATQMTQDSQALAEVRSLKTQMDVEKWKAEKKITPEVEQKMMDWFSQPVTQNGQIAYDLNGNPIIRGYLFTNGLVSLDDVYNFVGGNAPAVKDKVENLTEELRQEVKKEMSARQAAKSTKQGTTDSTQFGNPNQADDPFLDGLGL